jgi:hypothetical protein
MSEAVQNRKFFIGFGVVMSVQPTDIEKVCAAIESCGAKIIYQKPSTESFYVLRRSQVERILNGDTSELSEIHVKKEERRVEKK